MPGGCSFQDKWLNDPLFNTWVTRGKTPQQACCTLCNNKQIDLSTMGRTALISHSKSMKHKEKLNFKSNSTLTLFMKPSPSTSASAIAASASSSNTCEVQVSESQVSTGSTTSSKQNGAGSLNSFVTRNDCLKAEVWWCLRTAIRNHSFSSNSDIQFILNEMFPSIPLIQQFSCAETKSMYLTVYGIAPYLSSLLRKRTENENYVLMFDESLNKDMQKKQLDMWVRLWNSDTVQSRYLDSSFLGHACASDILSSFEDTIEGGIGYTNMVQLSMDGPNVNWSTFNQLQEKVEIETSRKLINIGSCGLHQLHNAFRAAVNATHWDTHHILSSLYTLFKDVPARREDYEQSTKQSSFPLKNCPHRWIENMKVCERALQLHTHVSKYVSDVKAKAIKNPDTKSYDVIEAWVGDPFAKAKLSFIISIARQVEKFLTYYQSDKPMLPFLADDLESLLHKLLKKFVKPVCLDNLNTFPKLAKFDPTIEENHKVYSEISLGCETDEQLKEVKRKVKQSQILGFRLECKALLVTLVKAILQKSPLNYSIVPALRCLDPQLIVEDQTTAVARFKKVLYQLKDLRRVKLSDVDTIIDEFDDATKKMATNESFQNFKKLTDRLDCLYYQTMHNQPQCAKAWAVIKDLLLLSHGQASVERGFSTNKECSDVNLSERSLVARRQIKDHINSIGGLKNMVVSKEMLVSASGARQKYNNYLEESKAAKQNQGISLKRKAAEDELGGLKKRFRQIESDHSHLLNEADKAYLKAEQDSNLSLVSQGNSLRMKAKDKSSELEILKSEIGEKEKLLKSSF